MTMISLVPARGPFLEGPEKFSHPESHSKISKLMIIELFYSPILNMNRGSLHTRSFRRIHFSVYRYRWTKNGFMGPKSFRGFLRNEALGARFSKVPDTFRTRKAIAKSRTLRLQSCFIHIFLIWREVPIIQEVSGVYTSLFLDTDGLKMALRARKVSRAFEKRAPGPRDWLQVWENGGNFVVHVNKKIYERNMLSHFPRNYYNKQF